MLELYIVTPDGIAVTQRVHAAALICVKTAAINNDDEQALGDRFFTQSHFDPTHSGRVTMDHLMKRVTTALEWTYEAHKTDVRTETLEQAAELLVLRRDTF